jgi:hypothetical protein
MRGESSEQEDDTQAGAAESGGEGAVDREEDADFTWDFGRRRGKPPTDATYDYDEEPPRERDRSIKTGCNCDEWDCEHYRAIERSRGRRPDYG